MLEYYRFKEVSELYAQNRSEEARNLLCKLQEKYIALCDENITLRRRVQEFENILYLTNNLIFDGQSYWLLTGSIKQGPFCGSCYDREGALIRLEHTEQTWSCPVCHDLRERTVLQPPRAQGTARSAKIIPFVR